MLYMVTFTINIPQMLAYIPYMDPMGILIFKPKCQYFLPIKDMPSSVVEGLCSRTPYIKGTHKSQTMEKRRRVLTSKPFGDVLCHGGTPEFSEIILYIYIIYIYIYVFHIIL